MSNHGMLIIFEGPDGVGKSALADRLAMHLRSRNLQVDLLAFPGKKPRSLGYHVYRLHHEARSGFGIDDIHPASLQAMHVAAHIDAIEKDILPAIRAGRTVILDRFWWSTWVYGCVAGVPLASLDAMVALEKVHWGDVRPATVFLVETPRPRREDVVKDNWRRLCQTYQQLAAQEDGQYPIVRVNNTRRIETASRQMNAFVDGLRTDGGEDHNREAESPGQGQRLGSVEPSLFTATPALLPARRTNQVSDDVLTDWAPAIPTVVYDTYWRFAAERQGIFFRKLRGQPAPWTEDLILCGHKFTNAYRASDRVSQYLIRRVIYQGDSTPDEVFFRTILFKTFNRIETWHLLLEELGEISYRDYSFDRYNRILGQAMAGGTRIYSAAYIMPSGSGIFRHSKKHQSHLHLIEAMIKDELPKRLSDAANMQAAFALLRSYPMIGDFLAYQYVTDLNYGELTSFSEMEFVVPGPGAKEGIHKCFSSLGGLSEVEVIARVTQRQRQEFGRLGLNFESLWGRQLQLIDCQNLFCEVAKYARLAHPDIVSKSGRTRIKQKYRPNPEPIDYWYPPKWDLNDKIEGERKGRHACV